MLERNVSVKCTTLDNTECAFSILTLAKFNETVPWLFQLHLKLQICGYGWQIISLEMLNQNILILNYEQVSGEGTPSRGCLWPVAMTTWAMTSTTGATSCSCASSTTYSHWSLSSSTTAPSWRLSGPMRNHSRPRLEKWMWNHWDQTRYYLTTLPWTHTWKLEEYGFVKPK